LLSKWNLYRYIGGINEALQELREELADLVDDE
jgi:hypothetical protein